MHILEQQQLLLAAHADSDPQVLRHISAAAASSSCANWRNLRLAAATLHDIQQVRMCLQDSSRAGLPCVSMTSSMLHMPCNW
jgi:hypothetical protein